MTKMFNMRFFNTVMIVLLGLMFLGLSSCAVSNDVVSKGLIQKRKYRKGWHIRESANTATFDTVIERTERSVKDNSAHGIERISSNSEPRKEMNLIAVRINNEGRQSSAVTSTSAPQEFAKEYFDSQQLVTQKPTAVSYKVVLENYPDKRKQRRTERLEPMAKTTLILFCITMGLIISGIIIPNPFVWIAIIGLAVAIIITSIIALVRLYRKENQYKGKILMWIFLGVIVIGLLTLFAFG